MTQSHLPIPCQTIGPVALCGDIEGSVHVPLATFETPLWPSTNRGAKVSRLCGGIQVTLINECMTRSIVVEGPDAATVNQIVQDLEKQEKTLQSLVAGTSRFAKLKSYHTQIVGNLLYLRLAVQTGDASGHNMATKAADSVIKWLCHHYPELSYVSISGNFCVDKKTSAVNGILGRGKNVVADITIPKDICQSVLKTTPLAIHKLHIKKNLVGSLVAGSLRTANAHFANILFAAYLATGQDVANIVEGSQGIVHTDIRPDGSLYFSVTLPNLIVGTVGNGKHLPFVKKHLDMLGCSNDGDAGSSGRRLALIIAATVLCGEVSLLAAQTNPGELMQAHTDFERGEATYREAKHTETVA